MSDVLNTTIPTQESVDAQFREFAKQTKEYIDALRSDYDLGDTPALGGMEFDIPIKNVAQAVAMLEEHCTKFVDDYTEILFEPLLVDEWKAVEEVVYNKLISYDFSRFTSEERKNNIYALTYCYALKRIVFQQLTKISLGNNYNYFCVGNINLKEFIAPALTTLSGSNSSGYTISIFTGLSSLTTLSLPALTTLSGSGSGSGNNISIFTGLSSLTTLSLPALTTLSGSSGSNGGNITSIFTGLSSLTTLSLPALTTLSGSGYTISIFTGLSSLTTLSLPALTTLSGSGNNISIFTGCVNLYNIELGFTHADGTPSLTSNLDIRGINPTNVLYDPEKLAILNLSFKTKVFQNLYDYTGGTAHTITMATELVNHLDADVLQVATDKNWTIVTA